MNTGELPFFDEYLSQIGITSQLSGIFAQGSQITGYADPNSDFDFVCVWDSPIILSDERLTIASRYSDISDFVAFDRPNGKKGDDFILGGKKIGVAHLDRTELFYGVFENLLNIRDLNEFVLACYRLGGFHRGKILKDPSGMLAKYLEFSKLDSDISLRLTKRLLELRSFPSDDLRASVARKSTLQFFFELSRVFEQLHVYTYLSQTQYPIAQKWFEREVEAGQLKADHVFELASAIRSKIDFDQALKLIETFKTGLT